MPVTAQERAAKELAKAEAAVESSGAKLATSLSRLEAAEATAETAQQQHDEAVAIRDHLKTHPALQQAAPAAEPTPTAAGLPVEPAPFDPFA